MSLKVKKHDVQNVKLFLLTKYKFNVENQFKPAVFLVGFFKDLWTSCLTNLCGVFKG